MRLRVIRYLVFGVAAAGGPFVDLDAAVISIDFNNTTASAWTLASTNQAGPLNSENWNSTSTASGGPVSLVDDTGAATTAALTWTSSSTWTNGDGNGTPNAKVAHAYLDDGLAISITVANVPFDDYRVYGLFASDNAAGIRNWQVNGAWVLGGDASTTADAYGSIGENFTNNGEDWTQIVPGSVVGNYWAFDSSGSTLTVSGQQGVSGSYRGSLTGLVIEAVPEPAAMPLLGMMAVGAFSFFRNRRAARVVSRSDHPGCSER